jgi:hypothetical protein
MDFSQHKGNKGKHELVVVIIRVFRLLPRVLSVVLVDSHKCVVPGGDGSFHSSGMSGFYPAHGAPPACDYRSYYDSSLSMIRLAPKGSDVCAVIKSFICIYYLKSQKFQNSQRHERSSSSMVERQIADL